MTIGQMTWKVIRAKDRHYTMRFMPDKSPALWHWVFFFAGALLISTNGNINFANHGGHFSAGFPQRFACFFSNGQRQRFFVFIELLRKIFHHVRALCKGQISPGFKSSTRRLKSSVYLNFACSLALPNLLIFRRVC